MEPFEPNGRVAADRHIEHRQLVEPVHRTVSVNRFKATLSRPSTLGPVSPGAKRVTIREVAEAAGVSQAAVSYALRGIKVSEETEERVRKVAADLGYEANPIARALASGRTGMVGILGPSLEDLWQQRFAAEAGRALLARDHFALIVDAGGDPDRQRMLATQLRDQQVDGLIISPVNPSDGFWTELAKALPVVSIGDALSGASRGRRGAVRQPHGRGARAGASARARATGGSRSCDVPARRPTTGPPRSSSEPRRSGSGSTCWS